MACNIAADQSRSPTPVTKALWARLLEPEGARRTDRLISAAVGAYRDNGVTAPTPSRHFFAGELPQRAAASARGVTVSFSM